MKENHNPASVRLRLLLMLLATGAAPLAACEDEATELATKPADLKREFLAPQGLIRLAPDSDIWLDLKKRRVIVDGHVTLRRGALEMFACPEGTKEHESIVAVNSKAQYVHAALLAAGAKSGRPARFDPDYEPATGTTIEVSVLWKERGATRQARAQEWLKNTSTRKEADAEWVFAGSGFWTDPSNGQRYYHGDGGDFICVSNFPTATLDLTIPSSQENADLLFEAYTEKIPPIGTPVRLLLTPRLPKSDESPKDKAVEDAEKQSEQPQSPAPQPVKD